MYFAVSHVKHDFKLGKLTCKRNNVVSPLVNDPLRHHPSLPRANFLANSYQMKPKVCREMVLYLKKLRLNFDQIPTIVGAVVAPEAPPKAPKLPSILSSKIAPPSHPLIESFHR